MLYILQEDIIKEYNRYNSIYFIESYSFDLLNIIKNFDFEIEEEDDFEIYEGRLFFQCLHIENDIACFYKDENVYRDDYIIIG